MSSYSTYFVAIATVSLLIPNCSSIYYDSDVRSCAVIFSSHNYSGFNRTLFHSERIPDLSFTEIVNKKHVNVPGYQNLEYQEANISQTWAGMLGSLSLQTDCKIQLCTEAYLEGNCTLLEEDAANLTEVAIYRNISVIKIYYYD